MLARVGNVGSARYRALLSLPSAANMSQRRYAGGAPSYNEPSGHLFGEKPPPKGQKREKQAWENMWYIGMYGGMVAFGVLYYFKPDRSVRHWATPEAEKRLNESGVPWRYKPSPYSGYPEGIPDEKK